MCRKHLGSDPTAACGLVAMLVAEREGFIVCGEFASCFKAGCPCTGCRHLAAQHRHSETQRVHSTCRSGPDAAVGNVRSEDLHMQDCSGVHAHVEHVQDLQIDLEEPGQDLSPKVKGSTDVDGKKESVSLRRRKRRLRLKSARRLVDSS